MELWVVQAGLSLETLSGKSEMFWRGRQVPPGVRLLVDRPGGRRSVKRLVSAHTQPMQEQIPYLNRLSSFRHILSATWLTCFFFACQYSVQIIRDQLSRFRSQHA
jgi:hypothetical protein